ncbi:MAG: hypothetical protein V7629_19000 [Motiliproteus sp.]
MITTSDPQFRMALEILARWGCSGDHVVAVLGMDPTDPPTDYSVDQVSRISAVLNLDSALRQRFNNPANVVGFMGMVNHNRPFNGATPLDAVVQGTLTLDEVARHVVHAGEW